MDKINAAEVKPLSEQGGVVTPQQWKFIKELCDEDGKITLVQAAVNAGYPKNKAQSTANHLTSVKHYPQVVKAIQEYRYQQAEKYGTTYERHMRDLQVIRDKALAAGNFGAAVSAEFRRGQALGSIYIDKKITLTGSIDSMSKEEVQRKLEEIKLLHGSAAPPEILDITPEQIETEPATKMLEAMRDGERTRRLTPQEIEAESAEIVDSSVGESSKSGDTRLPHSAAAQPLHHGGAQGSEERKESTVVTAPVGICAEAQLTTDASLHTGGMASEGHDKAD